MKEDAGSDDQNAIAIELPALHAIADSALGRGDESDPPCDFFKRPAAAQKQQDDDAAKAYSVRLKRLKRLKALRASPGFQLIAHSRLQLRICQMDMDYPPPLRTYVKDALKQLLRSATGKQLSADALLVQLSTDNNPQVNTLGHERYTRHLSLTEISMISLNSDALFHLMRNRFTDKPLHPDVPEFTALKALDLIARATWLDDYTQLVQQFWKNHRLTYRAVAKLAFLDNLANQRAQRRISAEGYHLALDAAGLKTFPTSDLDLLAEQRGGRSTVSMLGVGERVLPDVIQLQSKNTSHCFIHRLGWKREPVEYISNQPERMLRELTQAQPPESLAEGAAGSASLSIIEGDVFTAVANAQERLSLDYLDSDVGLDKQPDQFGPIERGLRLFGAIDRWRSQPDVLDHLPAPLKTAAKVMADALHREFGLEQHPDNLFLRYLRGHSQTPLGHVKHAGNDFSIADDTAISLSEALVSNYRVPTAVGYIDHGARNVVYLDVTGKGTWTADKELPIDARAIEKIIKGIDFLSLMTEQIAAFWTEQRETVESALQHHFINQSVLCLKTGSLRRDGFDLIAMALEELATDPASRTVEWSVPSFQLQHSILEGANAQSCPSLIVLGRRGDPRRVLYQAGRLKAFSGFANEDQLHHYVRQAARDKAWRQSVLNYVPIRQHRRLEYILKVWSAAQAPNDPVSVLRPWTDVLRNHDAHIAKAGRPADRQVVTSPFGYITQMLEHNSLWDAQDAIVTAGELSLRRWSSYLRHLQLLMAPMSILLTPVTVAALATELSITALSVAAANLPGARHAEKHQAILDVLTLGLLQLPPAMPRLANVWRQLAAPVRQVGRAPAVLTVGRSTFNQWLGRATHPRRTRVETFFHTTTPLKNWSVAANPMFSTLAVKAWKLRRQFLLWTSESAQARTLVVSTHGYYLPWSKNAKIPNGTELQFYAPHGYELVDPGLHRVVNGKTAPFAILTSMGNRPAAASTQPYTLTAKEMAGTTRPGMIKNYSLSKFQAPDIESYQQISQVVRNSNRSPQLAGLPPVPMDVLTVRNRIGLPHPTLEKMFDAFSEAGIHYDRILLLHCRCAALSSLLGKSPVYKAP